MILRKLIPFSLKPLIGPLLLGLICFVIYNANLRQIGASDTLPARYLPLILWRNGTLNFDSNARLIAHGHPMKIDQPEGDGAQISFFEPRVYWTIRTHQNQLASLYPVVTPMLVAPLYLPAVLWLNVHDWQQPYVDRAAELMEKLSAALLASLATMLMYLTLRRDGNRWSLPLALAFAFGTNTWMISSQALWQHGTGEVLIALALLLVTAPASPIRIALLGAVCVLMAANRPPDALIAGSFIFFIIWSLRRKALWLFAGAAVPLAALLYYNLSFMGHIAGGYALVTVSQDFFQQDWSGVLGLLVSPARGLLVFSPFLIFVLVGVMQRLRSSDSRWLAVALSVATIAQIVGYSQGDWRGGQSWGPRWLTDLLPILIWMLAPAPLVLRQPARSLLILLMVASVGVQTIGAFWYTRASDKLIFAGAPVSMGGVWDPHNIPFLIELQHPPAHAELVCDVDLSVDHIGTVQLPDREKLLDLGTGTVLDGWALTCGRTPAQILMLIDGIIVGATEIFLPRGDVNVAMNTTSPSGWRVSANTFGISPGEHVLQFAIRIQPRSDIRIVREQRVNVLSQEAALQRMATRAALLLREHQSEHGFWLTTHTKGLRYEDPQQEMNTFLTSMLVDLLTPIAQQQGLDDVMKRARQHLAAQIENNGLVRYHGLPDSPTIGKLGCIITPDADDTALVWRIAGPGAADSRQQLMLEELVRYRNINGLYRTWLAPQKQYQCIDPGSNPNPTDIAIQLHVYLMLRERDASAAQNLCNALQRSFLDDAIWVYYSKTAIVPYLRSAQLSQLGCPLPLPEARLALSAEGQEPWSEAARLLVRTAGSPSDKKTQQAIHNLLVQIASNDFAQLRQTPPLIYHNDLSAHVSRFYWSEDFGYALWLRLYEAISIETQ